MSCVHDTSDIGTIHLGNKINWELPESSWCAKCKTGLPKLEITHNTRISGGKTHIVDQNFDLAHLCDHAFHRCIDLGVILNINWEVFNLNGRKLLSDFGLDIL